MKTILLLLLMLNISLSAQTHRFIYEVQIKDDSIAMETRKLNMVLDINPDEVKFYDYDYVLNDSANITQGRNSMIWSDAPTIIRKKNTNQNRSYILLDNLFVIESVDKISWKLHKETKKSENYLLQKATTNFGGRSWIAWFTKDININEGPYKFRGLPGLIFELKDTKNNFTFNLVKSYKLPKTYETLSIIENFGGQKAINISEKKLHKILLDTYNDPLHRLKEQFKNNTDPTASYYVMSVEVKSLDQFKELTKMMQNHIRKNNNPIELDKAVQYP